MLVRLTDNIPVYFDRLREFVLAGVMYAGTTVNIERPMKRDVRVNPSDENTTRLFVVPIRTVGDGGILYARKSELVGRYKKV